MLFTLENAYWRLRKNKACNQEEDGSILLNHYENVENWIYKDFKKAFDSAMMLYLLMIR